MAIRSFGKASFVHIKDGTGRFQVYVRKDRVGEEESGKPDYLSRDRPSRINGESLPDAR